MIVEVTIDGTPLELVITCDTPEIITVNPASIISVTIEMFRDGVDGEKGSQGEKGDTGNQGPKGDTGEQGLKGDTGSEGSQGEKGDTGDQGPKGDTGSEGIQGEPGEPAINNTLELVRSENPQISGNIDANANTIENLRNAEANQEPATFIQAKQFLQEAKEYADTVSANTVRWAGYWSASTGAFPSVSIIRRGDEYECDASGTVYGVEFEIGDIIRARINTPGQIVSNWSVAQGNVQQSTEVRQGTLKIADSATVSDENSVNDSNSITSKKLWLNFWQRVLSLTWTWSSRQIFSVSPRFSSVTASQYLKVDLNKDVTSVGTIPSSDVAQDSTHRMHTDTQATTWDGKQNALGFSPENSTNKENVTLDTSTVKFPTNNLVKTKIDLKQDKTTAIADIFEKAILRDNYFWFGPNTIGSASSFGQSANISGAFTFSNNVPGNSGMPLFATSSTAGTIAFMRRNDQLVFTSLICKITRKIRFQTNTSGQRFFCGMTKGNQFSAPTNVDPGTLTDIIGVCQLATSTNMHIISNDSSGTATTIDLGSSYPCNDSQYNYFITIEQTATSYIITVERVTVSTGVSISTSNTVSTNIMNYATGTIQLCTWISNNAIAAIASYLDGGGVGKFNN